MLHRRLQGGTAISTSGSSGTRPVSLPSAYIPSSERVGSMAKTAPLNTSNPPTINVQSSGNGDADKQTLGEVQFRFSLKFPCALFSAHLYVRKTKQVENSACYCVSNQKGKSANEVM